MKTYTTEQGDTWDLIALRMFPNIGAEKLTDILLDYNPEHIHTVIFPANINLNIPEVNVPVVSSLPAWKR